MNINKLILNRWFCADNRYSPQKIGSNHTQDPYPGLCEWNTNFTVSPPDLECKLLYCVNGSDIPTELNYDNVTIGSTNNIYNVSAQGRVEMSSYLNYRCKPNFYIKNDTVKRSSASTSARVYCEDGLFKYPNPWPECVDDIICPDPGSTNELIRTNKTQPFNYTYDSQFEYKCKDLRSYVKTTNVSVPVAPSVVSTCQWKQTFDIEGTTLKCIIHHCGHPHIGNGSHQEPPPENNIELVVTQNITNNFVSFGSTVMYKCKTGMFIENMEITPTQNNITVECLDTGEYNIPSVWPKCAQSILCPDPGSTNELIRTDKTPQPFNFTYNSQLEYKCKDLRSYVKTTNVNVPLAPSVVSTCQWKKTYDIDGTTLKCVIHHCGHPNIGNGSHTTPFLVNNLKLTPTDNITNSFVSFGTLVMYECLPSMFIENSEIDPTKTNFTVKCLDTGLYELPSQWPNCTRTINCGAPPSKPDGGNMTWIRGTENSVSVLHLGLGVVPGDCSFMGTNRIEGNDLKKCRNMPSSRAGCCSWETIVLSWEQTELKAMI